MQKNERVCPRVEEASPEKDNLEGLSSLEVWLQPLEWQRSVLGCWARESLWSPSEQETGLWGYKWPKAGGGHREGVETHCNLKAWSAVSVSGGPKRWSLGPNQDFRVSKGLTCWVCVGAEHCSCLWRGALIVRAAGARKGKTQQP